METIGALSPPVAARLRNTNFSTRAICTRLGLRSVPQDLPSNTTVLDLSINLIVTLYNESFTYLPDIITLAIGRNQLSMIEDGAFGHLGNLTKLILERNRLMSLPAGLLSSNRLLSVLHLGSNKLSSIPTDALPWSDNITLFDLTNNTISFIKPSDFTPLQNCSSIRLFLSNNALTNLPSNAFSALNKVNKLILSKNTFQEFHISSILANNEIDALVLSACKINLVIPLNQTHSHVDGSPKIYLINLQINKLSSFPNFAFWGLNQTSILILRQNHINILSNRTFCGLDQLIELDLSYNRLTSLPLDMFFCNKMLQRLMLVGNNIASWSIGILSNLSSLNHLDLARNNIKDIEGSTKLRFPSLAYLDLSFNKLTQIKKYFLCGFTNLKILNMSHNEIQDTYSPNAFVNLKNLKELYLTNEPHEVINGAFRYLDTLCILDLSFAEMTIHSKLQFTNATSLVKLVMRENRLASTDLFDNMTSKSFFLGLQSLVRLDLRGNHLDMLEPGTFNPLKRLEILLLSQSSIKVLIPSVFDSLASLTSLDLRDNEISTIPGYLLQSQPRLGVLYITNNKLDSIPKTLFKRTPSLHHLYMQRNRITTIEPGTVFPTNKTMSIHASGNPFSCTCDLSWFVGWLRSGNVELIHPEDTLCSLSSIKDMVQSPILSFHPDQYCGINILIITGVSFSVVLVAVLVAVLCLVAYRKRWWLNYKLFLLKLAIFGYEEINQDFDAQDYEYQLNLMYDENDQEWVDQVMKPVLQERFPHLQKVAFGDNNLNIEMFYIPSSPLRC